MNQLKQEHLSAEEFAHYVGIDAVEGVPAKVGERFGEQLAYLQDEHEGTEQRADELEDKVNDLQDDVDEAELHADNIEADLKALSDELRILFVKYPNLKNSVPDLHEVYQRVKREGLR